jgi:glucose/arabinose dehydrogenase
MNELKNHSRTILLSLALALLSGTAVLAQPAFELRPVATGLVFPVAITHAGDTRLFITLQRGQVVIYDGTRVLPTPFLDIRSIVNCPADGGCGEQGLLSVAFHPDYATNGRFFVYHTDLSGDLVIARYNRSAFDANRADPSSRVQILKIAHPVNANHNGGQLQFGPDGYLYIGTGDGGAGGDPPNNGQTLTALLGKMLRIDVDSGNPYSIPPSNPFALTDNARGEVWAYGLRNPWRFSFDRLNGDLWIADVGQGDWEEIDLQPATSIGGENYGWRRMEGTHCYPPGTSGCQTLQMVLPIIEYDHSVGCSVTGGYRYRGSRSTRLYGKYVYSDYCSGDIWAASLQSNGRWTTETIVPNNFFVSAFGEDLNGEIYVARHSASGGVYQLVDPAGGPSPRRRAVRR